MLTASKRCLEFWLPSRLYSTHNQQVYGRLKIKSGKFENIPLHKVPDVICVFTKFATFMAVLEKCEITLRADLFGPKKLRIDRQGGTDCDRSTSVNLLPWLLAAGTLLSKTLCLWSYRVSLKKGTFLIFCLISVLEVGFYFVFRNQNFKPVSSSYSKSIHSESILS